MDSKKKIYSKEFKEKAVLLSCQRDNLKKLAKELCNKVERLYKWRRVAKGKGVIPSENEITGTKTVIDTTEVKQ